MRRLLLPAAAAMLLLVGCSPAGPQIEAAPDVPAGPVSTAAPQPGEPSSAEPSTASGSSPPTSAGSTSATPPSAGSEPTSSALDSKSSSSQPAQVPDTLRFSATTVDGEPFDGATLAGRPALLWFWAPWCPTCRGQIDEVRNLAASYDGTVEVVGVGSLDDAQAIRGFADDATGVVHLVDEQGEVWKHFGVAEQSSFVLLDPAGKQVWQAGYGGTDDLADRVAQVAG